MQRLPVFPLALLLALPLASAAGQGMAAQAPVRVTTTAVSRVTLFRVLPGQAPAYARDVVEHLMPIYEEYKKAGLITSYGFFSKTTTEAPDDWNVGVILTYANFAGLDNLGTKTDPITLKHYGSAEKRTAAGNARAAIRTVVSSVLTQSQSFGQ